MDSSYSARIPLRAQDGSITAYALVDLQDFVWLTTQYRWYTRRWKKAQGTYVTAKRSRKERAEGLPASIHMHREILGLAWDDRRVVDHINGDPLDNRRCNLRIVTSGENQQNRRGPQRNSRSGVRGVCWETRRGRWIASAQVGANRLQEYFDADSKDQAEACVRAWRLEHMPFAPVD